MKMATVWNFFGLELGSGKTFRITNCPGRFFSCFPEPPQNKTRKTSMTYLDKSTVLITGGSGRMRVDTVLFANTEQEVMTLNQGPKLAKSRSSHACGQVSYGSQTRVVVVVGGLTTGSNDPIAATEILEPDQDVIDSGSFKWKAGPDFPLLVSSPAGVSGPDGQFLVIGGRFGNWEKREIFQLVRQESGDCQWAKNSHELVVGRSAHLAMMVPGGNYVSCMLI